MSTTHSVEFLRELFDLSEASFMISLNKLVDKGDLASVANAAQVLAEKGSIVLEEDLPYDLNAIATQDAVSSFSYSYIFAKAMGPRLGQAVDRQDPMAARLWDVQRGQATPDYAMPEDLGMDADQRKIFETILPLYVNSRNQTNGSRTAISSLFTELVQHRTSADVIDRVLAAGADPSVNATVRYPEGRAGFLSSTKVALASGNLHAVAAIAKSGNEEAETSLRLLVIDADIGARSAMNPAKAIASTMALQGRNYKGLSTLAVIEAATEPSIELRCKVLGAYLEESAQRRIGWDPLQVEWMMGHPATQPGMPPQTRGFTPKSWAKAPDYPTNDLLTMALQTHCHPVLTVLADRLVQLQQEGTLPPAFSPNTKTARAAAKEGSYGINHLTALGLTMHPINADFRVLTDHFEGTVDLLQRLDLIKDDTTDLRSSRPALHTAAREMGDQTGWALTRLLDMGVPAEVKNTMGRVATHGMPASEKEAWNTIVRSYKARSAATEALGDIRRDLGL